MYLILNPQSRINKLSVKEKVTKVGFDCLQVIILHFSRASHLKRLTKRRNTKKSKEYLIGLDMRISVTLTGAVVINRGAYVVDNHLMNLDTVVTYKKIIQFFMSVR